MSQLSRPSASPVGEDLPSSDELAFWDMPSSFLIGDDQMELPTSVLREEPDFGRVYDLSERVARFGESVIRFAKNIPFNAVNNRLIEQFVGAGTSVGANHCEADDWISAKDFRHRISICRKESNETRFWLRMLATAEPSCKDAAHVLWREAAELNLIFGSIWRRAGKNI